MTSSRVIRIYLTISGLYTLSASLIWGVNTLFLLDAGLSIAEVFIANSIFTGAMAAFEIPTGVIADTRGRRVSFLSSLIVLALGTIGYVVIAAAGGSLLWFGVMSIVLGLGYTFYSGAVEAWLVDALNHTGFKGNLDQIFARGSFITGAAMLAGTVGGGVIGGLSLAAPFILRAVLLLILFGVSFYSMHDLGYQPSKIKFSAIPKKIRQEAKDSIQFGWKQQSLRLIIIVGLIQGSFFAWAWYAWQPYFLNLLGQEKVWIAGVVAALISLAMMAGNSIVEYLTRFCGRRTTLLLWSAAVFSLAMIGVGLVSSFWSALILLLVAMLASGVNQPVRQAFIHRLIPTDQRATIVSFDSMVASGGSMVGQSALGYVAQIRSFGSGYLYGGVFTMLAFPVWLLLRRQENSSDYFAGQTAGAGASCAAQGLPTVSAVNAKPVISLSAE